MITQHPDVSFWQGLINFALMRTKTDYIIFRSSQADYSDFRLDRNVMEAKRVKLPFGFYHFYDDKISPSRQADVFAALINYHKPQEIWCDWEKTYGGSYSGLRNVVAFMERVEQLTWMQCGMYTGYFWFFENSNSITNASQYRYLADKKLWLAWYNDDRTNIGIENVKIPKPWSHMDVWQYSEQGPGYDFGAQSKELDMNERFDGFVPSNDVPLPPTGDDMTATYNCVARYKAKVRLAPNTNNTSTEYVLEGEHFQVSEIVPDSLDPTNIAKKWGHITGGMHDGKYTALEYPNNDNPISTYTPIEVVSEPPTPPAPASPQVKIEWDNLKRVTITTDTPLEIIYNLNDNPVTLSEG